MDNLKGKVIAVPTNFFFDKTDYEVEKLVMEGVAAMKDLGAEVRHIEIPSLELVPNVSTVILFSEAAQYHKERFAKYPDKYQPGVKARLNRAALTRRSSISTRLRAVKRLSPTGRGR